MHVEAEEEEEQTRGGLEMVRLVIAVGPKPLVEALKTRVEGFLSLDADAGRRRSQRHGQSVRTPVSDHYERRGGGITAPNRDAHLRDEEVALPRPLAPHEPGRSMTDRLPRPLPATVQ